MHTPKDLAKAIYQLKVSALERSNASQKVTKIQKELKLANIELSIDSENIELQHQITYLESELVKATEIHKNLKPQTYEQADSLHLCNSIFQYLLSSKVLENEDVEYTYVWDVSRQSTGIKVLVISWPDGIQAVCLARLIQIPSNIEFKQSLVYKRANVADYEGIDMTVDVNIPSEQKLLIYSYMDRVKPVIYPKVK